MKPIDIGPADLETVRRILQGHVPELDVWAFGSRVSWTARETSDLDIALMTTEPLDVMRLAEMREAFVQSDLPFRVDIVDWSSTSKAFQNIIERNHVAVQKKTTRSKAGNRWHKTALGDVVDLRISGVDKKTKHNEHAIHLCNYTDVYNNSFIHSDLDFMTATATELEISNCTLNAEDVIITKDSEKYDDIGVPALVRENIPNLVCGYHLAILRPSLSDIDGAYLFYALITDDAQHQFQSYANGITRFGLRKADIGLIEIPLPPLPDQRVIGYILRTLDDKIEMNRQMNRTLEEMARALFKSWFVNFEPVRAKMDGRWYPGKSLSGLPACLYDLFPDRLVDSKLGKVPKGWKIGVLDDAIELLSGGTPRTSIAIYWGGDIPWYTAKDAPSPSDIFVLDTERTITQAGVTNSSTKILPIGTTVITARGTVGRLACLGAPMAMNQTCYGIRGILGYSDFFTYWNVRMTVDQLQRRTHGTIFDTITRQTFKLVDTVLPPTALAEVFESMVSPMMERMLGNARECCALSAQRDALLPKMMSGELRIFQLVHGRNTTK